jgi:hypothetical protein
VLHGPSPLWQPHVPESPPPKALPPQPRPELSVAWKTREGVVLTRGRRTGKSQVERIFFLPIFILPRAGCRTSQPTVASVSRSSWHTVAKCEHASSLHPPPHSPLVGGQKGRSGESRQPQLLASQNPDVRRPRSRQYVTYSGLPGWTGVGSP